MHLLQLRFFLDFSQALDFVMTYFVQLAGNSLCLCSLLCSMLYNRFTAD